MLDVARLELVGVELADVGCALIEPDQAVALVNITRTTTQMAPALANDTGDPLASVFHRVGDTPA